LTVLDFKVKGQGHSGATYHQISTLGCIFSPISRMHRHILMKLTIVTHRVHVTLMSFSGSWVQRSKGQGHRHHFPKVHFSVGVLPLKLVNTFQVG